MSDPLEEQKSNAIAWFITGAVIGITAALLYAPKAGRESRQSIAGAAQRGTDAVSETSTNIVEGARDMFDRGRKLVEDAADLFERGRKLVRG
jgi:gas vesicle protein